MLTLKTWKFSYSVEVPSLVSKPVTENSFLVWSEYECTNVKTENAEGKVKYLRDFFTLKFIVLLDGLSYAGK